MNFALTAQQFVHFREHGSIRFSQFPLDFQILTQVISEALKKGTERDLWRKSPHLQKIILRTLAPLILELTGKKGLRIASDQYFAVAPTPESRIQDFFSFQGLAAVAIIQASEAQVEIVQPSSLASHIAADSYVIVYAKENAQFIDNPRDLYAQMLKKMGYAYGDFLINEHHPLIFPQSPGLK